MVGGGREKPGCVAERLNAHTQNHAGCGGATCSEHRAGQNIRPLQLPPRVVNEVNAQQVLCLARSRRSAALKQKLRAYRLGISRKSLI